MADRTGGFEPLQPFKLVKAAISTLPGARRGAVLPEKKLSRCNGLPSGRLQSLIAGGQNRAALQKLVERGSRRRMLHYGDLILLHREFRREAFRVMKIVATVMCGGRNSDDRSGDPDTRSNDS
jgi:hypothetical protein